MLISDLHISKASDIKTPDYCLVDLHRAVLFLFSIDFILLNFPQSLIIHKGLTVIKVISFFCTSE